MNHVINHVRQNLMGSVGNESNRQFEQNQILYIFKYNLVY